MNKSPFLVRVLSTSSTPPVSRVVYESSHMQRALTSGTGGSKKSDPKDARAVWLQERLDPKKPSL